MPQHQETPPKSTIEPKAKTKDNQPKLTELTPEQLEQVGGGLNCVKGVHIKKATITG